MTAEQMFFCLLRNELNHKPIPQESFLFQDPNLFQLAKCHDLQHLIADALIRNELLPPDDPTLAMYSRAQMTAVYREVQLRRVTETICAVFQREEIPFVPMKGTVIRELYPEPWMRTSCDIDILVHEEDLSRAVESLKKSGFETDGKQHYHDVSLFLNHVHLELHYGIVEDMEQIDRVLRNAWDHVTLQNGSEYREQPAFFTFHHIAHMFYHFAHGGCGIRPFLDFWILRRSDYFEEKKLLPFLEECDLIPFYQCICKLTEYWLDQKGILDDFTASVQRYILTGGVYGDYQVGTALSVARKQGRFRYLLERIFPSYKHMSLLYPILKRHRILLPICYLCRIFAKIFGKDRKRAWKMVQTTMKQNQSQIDSVDEMLKKLNIQ